jgi:4-amino-4-deoxy-L-arabinose transferase-like glycosyltransferase
MLLPALGLASGVYLLAKRLCPEHAFAAAAATMLAPATLVSATTVMVDVTMLCFFVWSVYLWMRGLDEHRTALLAMAAVLAALAALSKYFGVSLIPLLAVYALLRTRRLGAWAVMMLIPIAILAAYQSWTASLYGRGLLLDAAGYAAEVRSIVGSRGTAKLLTSLTFVGGCAATAVGAALATGRRSAVTTFLVAAGLALAVMLFFEPFAGKAGATSSLRSGPWFPAQVALFAAGGVVLLWQALRCWWRQRSDPDATLLILWLAGTLAFATLVNWSTNARAMLPLTPAAAMLVLRRSKNTTPMSADDVDEDVASRRWTLATGVWVGAALAFAAAIADYSLAQSVRSAADAFAQRLEQKHGGSNWFLGHWGFQWYMEQHGFTSVDASGSVLMPGDRIAVPLNNSNVHRLPESSYRTVERVSFPTAPLVTIMNRTTGAGFYSDVWGPLPLALGPAPAEEYRLDEVTRRMALRTQ